MNIMDSKRTNKIGGARRYLPWTEDCSVSLLENVIMQNSAYDSGSCSVARKMTGMRQSNSKAFQLCFHYVLCFLFDKT